MEVQYKVFRLMHWAHSTSVSNIPTFQDHSSTRFPPNSSSFKNKGLISILHSHIWHGFWRMFNHLENHSNLSLFLVPFFENAGSTPNVENFKEGWHRPYGVFICLLFGWQKLRYIPAQNKIIIIIIIIYHQSINFYLFHLPVSSILTH